MKLPRNSPGWWAFCAPLVVACGQATPRPSAAAPASLAPRALPPAGAASVMAAAKTPANATETCAPEREPAELGAEPADAVGGVLLGTFGLPLSSERGKPADQRMSGAPALVVERAADALRLVAADGRTGWSPKVGALRPGGVVFDDVSLEVTSQIVEPTASAPEDLQIQPIGARFASITGASPRGKPEEIWQVGAGSWRDDTTFPWLRVQSSAAAGWLPPSAARVIWPAAERPFCGAYSALNGLVRAPFLTRARRTLAALLPAPGAPLPNLMEDPDEAWPAAQNCRAEAAIFAHEGEAPTLVMFDCGARSQVFAYSARGHTAHFVASAQDRSYLSRYELVDIDGDPKPELILELGLSWSHDYQTVLLVLPSEPLALPLGLFGLDLQQDEVDANWSVDAAAREINVTRTSKHGLELRRLRRSAAEARAAASATAPVWPFAESAGYAGVFSVHATQLAAERESLRVPGAMVFPLSRSGPKRWAVGNVFASAAAACAALHAQGATAALALSVNHGCKAVSK